MIDPKITSIIHDPQTVGNLAEKMIGTVRQNPNSGIRTGIEDLDKELLPLRPSELISVIGYTSNYKSGLMNFIAKTAVRRIQKENLQDHLVIKVTWEQSVEEDTVSWLANETNIPVTQMSRGLISEAEWQAIQDKTTKRQSTPMWIIGHSQREAAAQRHSRPRMTMTDVSKALAYVADEMTDMKFQYDLIVLDYLQRVRPDPGDGDSRREQMIEAVNKSKDMAVQFGCPVLLGVQAGRQVVDRQGKRDGDIMGKLPRLDDGQETSNIEQSSDKILSVWYPIKTEGKNADPLDGIPVTENLLVVGILKQKLGPAPIVKALYVDPGKNIIRGIQRHP